MFPTVRMPALRSSGPARRDDAGAGWTAALFVAVAWAVLPLIPALREGAIPGSPFTDLYPSVWGLAWFAGQQPGFPTFTELLAAPGGMPFYFSSPLHGWVAAPLLAVGGPVLAYAGTLVLARCLGVLVAFGAFRAAGLGPLGALAAATVYGASPYVHGYAVEGIVEGTDVWTLPLWAWMVLTRRRAAACLAFALVPLSSWYLGLVGCLLAAAWGLRERLAWTSLAVGLALVAPFVWLFTEAMPGAAPLPDAIRAAMGAPLGPHPPGILPGLNPFAITTYLGFSVPALTALALATRTAPLPGSGGRGVAQAAPALAIGAAACAVLSLGVGPWYELPVLASVRFPYRWHAGTLFCLAPLVGLAVDRLGRRWIAVLPLVEGMVLSPVELVVPSAPAGVPAIYDEVTGPSLLEVPGPLAMPPGEVNRSRPRARYLLYFQLHHGASSPWAPDFNGLGATPTPPWLATFQSWDPLLAAIPEPPDVAGARAAGVTQLMLQLPELKGNAQPLLQALEAAGAAVRAKDETRVLLDLPDAPRALPNADEAPSR
jgi:hypothetical protein